MSSHRLSLLAGWALLLVAACDPVHSNARDALGGEARGVAKGPLHRPGQPCTVCHDGALGDPPEFTVAGTIYARPSDRTGAANLTVTMLDSSGSRYAATTNEAGNFYVTPREWTPVFPITSVVVEATSHENATVRAVMYSQISWSSSCSSCHSDPAGPSSPGRVILQLEDGGTPP